MAKRNNIPASEKSVFELHNPKEMLATGRQSLIREVLQFRESTSGELAKAVGLSLDDTLTALAELERMDKVFRFKGKWRWKLC